jgi:hypothetical protein
MLEGIGAVILSAIIVVALLALARILTAWIAD